MRRWLLYKIDGLIHRYIPHPECKRTHWTPGSYANKTANTANTAVYYWTNAP